MGRKNIHQAARVARGPRLYQELVVQGVAPRDTEYQKRLPKDRAEVRRMAFQCWNCGIEGHKHSECPAVECNLCGGFGHMKRHCPQRTK